MKVAGIETPAHETLVDIARRRFPDADTAYCQWTYPVARPVVHVYYGFERRYTVNNLCNVRPVVAEGNA